ncbi:MAG TPA: hypothetical protein VK636_19725 [Gemmatimonadaceae bacterium]|nr:hypothetical protein [Gemmatimonadaceae bacterium]
MTESRLSLLHRAAALVAGLVVLLAGAIISVGLVLLAPLGVWVVHRFQRARGGSLDGWGSWMSAASAVTVGLLVIGGVVTTRLPAGSWSQIRQAADSASEEAAKQPPPAWLSRVVPGSASRYSTPDAKRPTVFNGIILIWGIGIAAGMIGSIIGTVGWIGTMLLVFYASGHWLRVAPPVEIEPIVD